MSELITGQLARDVLDLEARLGVTRDLVREAINLMAERDATIKQMEQQLLNYRRQLRQVLGVADYHWTMRGSHD